MPLYAVKPRHRPWIGQLINEIANTESSAASFVAYGRHDFAGKSGGQSSIQFLSPTPDPHRLVVRPSGKTRLKSEI